MQSPAAVVPIHVVCLFHDFILLPLSFSLSLSSPSQFFHTRIPVPSQCTSSTTVYPSPNNNNNHADDEDEEDDDSSGDDDGGDGGGDASFDAVATDIKSPPEVDTSPSPSPSPLPRPPFFLQLSLRSPVTSCENLAAPPPAYTRQCSFSESCSSYDEECCCLYLHTRGRWFCQKHVTYIICIGLISLFIFNMALYSFIFYQAHLEGHGF
jgi:hypothetical protein